MTTSDGPEVHRGSSAGTWQVWAVDVADGKAVAVAEGTETEMTAAAGTKNMAAERHAPGLVFMALPGDQQPSFDDAQAILIERNGAATLTPAGRDDPAVFAALTGEPFSPPAVWKPVLMDLLELDMNGHLAGVRAIVAELLTMIRRRELPADLPAAAAAAIGVGRAPGQQDPDPWFAQAAAMLAAQVSQARSR